jgi:hypothetical protein
MCQADFRSAAATSSDKAHSRLVVILSRSRSEAKDPYDEANKGIVSLHDYSIRVLE